MLDVPSCVCPRKGMCRTDGFEPRLLRWSRLRFRQGKVARGEMPGAQGIRRRQCPEPASYPDRRDPPDPASQEAGRRSGASRATRDRSRSGLETADRWVISVTLAKHQAPIRPWPRHVRSAAGWPEAIVPAAFGALSTRPFYPHAETACGCEGMPVTRHPQRIARSNRECGDGQGHRVPLLHAAGRREAMTLSG